MIKYSELENDFTIDCDGCGNFYAIGSTNWTYSKELYRLCSDKCKKFAFDRMKLITQTIKPTLEHKKMPKKEVCPNCTCCNLVELQGELVCYDCGYKKETVNSNTEIKCNNDKCKVKLDFNHGSNGECLHINGSKTQIYYEGLDRNTFTCYHCGAKMPAYKRIKP